MNAENRRKEIIQRLRGVELPLSATTLAKEFGVSRQVIVGDIALLRAQGFDIVSLARGYVFNESDMAKRVFKVHHSDGDVEKELNLFVDMGATVVDVFVYHRRYGTVRADMGIRSRNDVAKFINDISTGRSSLLKNVTDGYHYHTIQAENEQILDEINQKLEENGFLAPLQEYEPDGVGK